MVTNKMTTAASELKQSQLMIAGLLKADAYHHVTENIHLLQTHSAWIILTGEFAYKIKKPVNFGFLDFSTLEKRRLYCEKEVQLNKRFAPEIYLSVEKICGSIERPYIGAEENPLLDYAVKMRQFPEHNLLSDLSEKNILQPQHIDQMISLIANFHLSAKKASAGSAYGTATLVKHWMLENFEHLSSNLKTNEEKQVLDHIHAWVLEQNIALEPVFFKRKAGGMIRDCHGDLHLRNLTLINNQVMPFDCIEFNDELRWIDIISEVAFLMMDLAERGYPEFTNRFINGYLQATGDYEGLKLLPYYLVYRAIVRAKVAILRRGQVPPDSDEYQTATAEYLRYVQFAKQCMQQKKPISMITFGLSGSGKSTVAFELSQKLGVIQIRSDIERKRLLGMAAEEKSQSGINNGIYSENQSALTYQRLLDLAASVLDAGYSVLLDATYLKKKCRDQVRLQAQRKGVSFLILYCNVAQNILQQRILQRESEGKDASEATLEVLKSQQAKVQPLSEEESKMTLEVDTNEAGYLQKLLKQARLYR